jgi:hypothetical protein
MAENIVKELGGDHIVARPDQLPRLYQQLLERK